MESEEGLVECAFLIPLVRNSDRCTHRPLCWALLEDALYRDFGGRQGPEDMGRHRARPDRLYRSVRSVPGEYRDRKESRGPDECWRYIVAVARPRVRELRRLLERAANTFDQESISCSIKGDVEFVKPTDDLGLE